MKSRRNVVILASLSLLVGWSQPVAAADRMKAGLWEVTTSEGGQSQVNTHCVTADQAKGSNGTEQEVRAALETGAASLHCAVHDFAFSGDTIAYTYVCPNRSTTSSTSYHGDRYESVVTSKASTGSHTRQITGRRLGDCP